MNSHEQVRQDQVNYGRSTLHAKSNFKGKKQAPSPKGHEAFLNALVKSEAEIEIEKCSGEMVVGKIKHADKYTISIQVNDDTRVIFKHDISEFRAITPRKTTSD